MAPIDPVGDGRDERGRFGAGNRFSQGNPYARKVAALRRMLFAVVKPKDLREVVAALLTQAKAGDVASIRELLSRTLGEPQALDLLQRVEDIEDRLAQTSQEQK